MAFGSGGTEARPAEQTASKQIKLSGGITAYAGVKPKTAKGSRGKEQDSSIIVAVGDGDSNSVSLPVGTITVDHPIVTNWRTAPKDAVPSN
ncbi:MULTISPECIES: hypothetical protein [unclassified Streptomyces]|uniref:hypothetical protein n=1 Tax=unclassified Streptomyces TaxID=2593676 RepID=UPI00381FFE7D